MLCAYNNTFLAAFVVVGLSAITFGQAGLATVRGKVTDPGGLVVVGASVEASNLGTSVTYPAATNDAGFYSLSSLPPGRYSLTVQKAGSGIVKPEFDLHVADDISLNVELELARYVRLKRSRDGRH